MPTLPATLHWPALLVPALTLAAILVLARRASARRRVPRRAVVLAGSGFVLLTAALVGPLDFISERRLLSAHIAQHIVVMSIAPTLLLGGLFALRDAEAPPPASPASAGLIVAGCLIGSLVVIWLLHSPPAFDAALDDPILRDLHHLPLLIAGFALAWPLLDPARLLAGFGGPIYLVLAEIGLGVMGIWLAWYPSLVYDAYRENPGLFGLSDATDQSLAGAILLVVEEPLLAAEFAVLFIRALGDDDGDD